VERRESEGGFGQIQDAVGESKIEREAAAKRAGRHYPNLVDNMRAAKRKR